MHSSRCGAFFQSKSTDSFLISPQNHMFWYSLEEPHYFVIPPLIWSNVTLKKTYWKNFKGLPLFLKLPVKFLF